MSWRVIVEDGRATRNPALVTEEGGEILAVVEMDTMPELGDRVILADGSDVTIIGGKDEFSDRGMQFTAHIGDWPTPPG